MAASCLACVLAHNGASWIILAVGIVAPFYILFKLLGFSGFTQLVRYAKGQSFLYRLHPLSKLVALFALSLALPELDWWVSALFDVLVLIAYLTLAGGRRKFRYALYLAAAIASSYILALSPRFDHKVSSSGGILSDIIWVWPQYFRMLGYARTYTVGSFLFAVHSSLVAMTLPLAVLLLLQTNTPSEVFRAFSKLGVPSALTFSLIVAVRTVPAVVSAAESVVKIQLMRGLGSRFPSFIRPAFYLEAAIMSVIPVMVFLARDAKNIAVSADTRAFRAFPKRTYLTRSNFGYTDALLLVACVALLAVAYI